MVEGTGLQNGSVPCRSDAGGSRGVLHRQSGFTYETSDIQCTGEDVAEILGFGTVCLAEPRRAFQVSSGLVGVATFGVTEATDTQVPGRRADFEITG